jgi:Fe2+ or Zn2+ uptake regulation protein
MSNYKKRNLKNNQICEMIIYYLKENNNFEKKQSLIRSLIKWASLSTIYRGISRLEKKGLTVTFDVDNDKYIAYIGSRPNKSLNLVFFVCDVCKQKFWLKLNDSALDKICRKMKKFYDFDSKFVLYEFHGVCRSCLLSKSSNPLSLKKEETNYENSSYANR